MINVSKRNAGRYYKTFQLQTAPKPRAIYLLHEKCVHLMRQAVSYTEKRGVLCSKAQNILAQLQSSLTGGDNTTRSLFLLYDYAYTLLESGTTDHLRQAIEVMVPIKDSFYILLNPPRV